MSNRTRASIVDNDAILQRLDHEHLAALERFTTLSEADVDAEVDERPETKTACRAFDAIGFTAAAFPATSLKGLKLKTRILARQGRALTAGEMLFKEGEILQRLGVSVLATRSRSSAPIPRSPTPGGDGKPMTGLRGRGVASFRAPRVLAAIRC